MSHDVQYLATYIPDETEKKNQQKKNRESEKKPKKRPRKKIILSDDAEEERDSETPTTNILGETPPKKRKTTAKPKEKKVRLNPGTKRLRDRRAEFEGKTGVTGVDVGTENFAAGKVHITDGKIQSVIYKSLKSYGEKEPVAFEYAVLMPKFMNDHPEVFCPEAILAPEQQIVRNVRARATASIKHNVCSLCGVNREGLCQICGNSKDGAGKFGADMPIVTSAMIGHAVANGWSVELVVPANIKNKYDPGRTEKSHEINKKRVVEIVMPLLDEEERRIVNEAYMKKREELQERGRAMSGARLHDICDAILIAWFVIEALTGLDVVKTRMENMGKFEDYVQEDEEEEFGVFK